jgi:polysaccharide export outer membrane protein
MSSRRATIFFFTTLGLVISVASAQIPERDPRYRLQPDDVVEIQYRYTPEYNQTASVQPDGFVSLQLVGPVKLGGMTLEQAHATLVARASARLRDPEITIILKDFEKPYFIVGGEVAKPGQFELRGRTTAIEAIAIAGGFKAGDAKHSQVILFRRISKDAGETKILNLKQIMNAPQLMEDVPLHPGDMLLVPQNRVSKIERFIKWGNLGLYWNPMQR